MHYRPRSQPHHLPGQQTGLARALSKLGYCSRSQAWIAIEMGRVRVNGKVQQNPEHRIDLQRDRIDVDGETVRAEEKIYLMLNKPRGLVTTTSDEKGRETVFQCFHGKQLPWIAPVGRLDKASEGLLLFTNDTNWAARITDPESHLEKTYHVQIDRIADDQLVRQMQAGVRIDGELFSAVRVNVLRHGVKNSWIEVVLDEGKNRHIRRILEALHIEVLRLVRTAIGALELGTLPKGHYRILAKDEVARLKTL